MLALCGVAACVKVSGDSGGGRHPWTIPHVLRIVNVSEPDSLVPEIGNQQIDTDLSLFWAGYLFNYDDRNRFVPELATEVPTLGNGGISADGKTIVYHLRRGVKWQDGAPFTADDVIFTYDAIMNPRNNVNSRTGYDIISRIEKKGDYTVIVHLKHPWAPFVASFLTMSSTAYPVLPAHVLAKYPDINHVPYNEKPIGTGPFKVAQWQHGTLVKFVANPDYWRGPPRLKEIDYRPVPDANTILTELRTHEEDLDFFATDAQVKEFREIGGDRVQLVPFNAFAQIAFNLKNPILDDLTVRRALVAATNRQALVDDVVHGVELVGEGDQPPYLPWYDPSIEIEPYDPALAKRLLDQDGWRVGPGGIRVKDGKRLSLTVATTTGSAVGSATAVLLQRWWKEVGVELSVRTYVAPLMFGGYGAGGIIQTGKFDVAFYSWISGVDPDDSTEFMCDQFPPGGQNTYHFCDRRLDAAEHTALDSYDPVVRKRAYDEIQQILVSQRPFLTLWFIRRVNVYNSDLKNFKPAHAGVEIWNPWQIDI